MLQATPGRPASTPAERDGTGQIVHSNAAADTAESVLMSQENVFVLQAGQVPIAQMLVLRESTDKTASKIANVRTVRRAGRTMATVYVKQA